MTNVADEGRELMHDRISEAKRIFEGLKNTMLQSPESLKEIVDYALTKRQGLEALVDKFDLSKATCTSQVGLAETDEETVSFAHEKASFPANAIKTLLGWTQKAATPKQGRTTAFGRTTRYYHPHCFWFHP